MSEKFFYFDFAEHVPGSTIDSVLSGIGAYGNVRSRNKERRFEVEVFRPSNVPDLKRRFLECERTGMLRWYQTESK